MFVIMAFYEDGFKFLFTTLHHLCSRICYHRSIFWREIEQETLLDKISMLYRHGRRNRGAQEAPTFQRLGQSAPFRVIWLLSLKTLKIQK